MIQLTYFEIKIERMDEWSIPFPVSTGFYTLITLYLQVTFTIAKYGNLLFVLFFYLTHALEEGQKNELRLQLLESVFIWFCFLCVFVLFFSMN